MKLFYTNLYRTLLLLLLFLTSSLEAQNVTVSNSCFVGSVTLVDGGDATNPTLNGRPVYYNASANINFMGSPTTAEVYLYYELAATLGTPEDRWVIAISGQPYYYVISTDLTAPQTNYLPFDTAATPANCGGTATIAPECVTPSAPMAANQTLCPGSTVANLTATGSNLQWYSAPTGGSPLTSTTVLTSGNYYVSQTVSGCESTRTTVVVTVADTTPPTITAPAAVTTPTNNGCGAQAVNLGTPTTADNCTVASVTNNAPATFPLGNTTVTWTVTDGAGNTATATQVVTVVDTMPPAFSGGIIPSTLYYTFEGTGTTVPNLATTPPSGASTAILEGTITQGAPGICGVGSLIGSSGNSSTTRLNTNWNLNLTSDWTISFKTQNINTGSTSTLHYIFGESTTSFRCFTNGVAGANNWILRGTGLSDVLVPNGATATNNTITFVYSQSTANIKAYLNGVLVNTVSQSPTLSLVGTTPFIVGGYSSTTGLPAGGLMDEFGLYNRAITDTEAMQLSSCAGSCPSNITLNSSTTTCGAVYTYTTPNAIDNCSVTVVQTSGLPSGSNFPIGTTTNTFVATDGSGNTSTCSFAVTVQDVTPPTVVTQNISVQLNAAGTVTVSPSQVNNGSTDNCSIAALSLSQTSFNCANVGANTVTLTVTDVNGNSSTGTATVTVQDVTPPTVITQNRTIQLNAAGTATISATQINNGSSDACGVAAISLSPNSFTCANIGNNTVTLTVIDVNGNSSTGTATVTVQDVTPPTVITQNRTIQLNAAGQATITSAQINNGSTDNCGIVSLTLSQTIFTCANVGANTVTLTATDASGNSSTGTATVTVQDVTPPTVITQNRTIQLNAAGTATISATQINNGSSDACGIAAISLSPNSFTCANIGNNTVTLTVIDVNGNSSTGTATVTVHDVTPPTVVTQNITIQLNAAGQATITSAQINNGSTDNCGIVSLTLSQTSFTCANVGANTVTLTATDASGNSSTGTATVTVQDVTPPTVVTQNITVQLNAAGTATISAGQINNGSSDACGIATLSVTPNTFTCATIGTNTVTLTVTDVNGNSSTGTATVTVQDTTAPIITCPPTLTLNNTPGLCTANPNYCAPQSGFAGAFAIANWTTSNTNNGNGTVNTSNAPNSITLSSSSNTNVNGSSLLKFETLITCNGTISFTYDFSTVDSGGPVFDQFGYVKNGTFTPIVSSGPNVQSGVRNISVNAGDTFAFAVLNLDQIAGISTTVGYNFMVTSPNVPTAIDNCGIQSITVNNNGPYPVGSTIVTWTATDFNGNSSTCNQTIVVTDTQLPTVITQNQTVQLNAAGQASITAAQINNGSFDNCAIATVTVAPSTFNCTNLGANTVVLTVTDVNGNVNTATATVTVQDLINPTVITQNITVPLGANGQVTVNPALVNNGSFDNCNFTLTLTPNTFGAANVGQNTVILVATDTAGNVSFATATVTIIDNTPPVVVTQPVTVFLNAAGTASVTATQVNNGSTDNTSIASLTVAPSTFTCANLGTNTVTLTVTDVNGNSAAATAIVTVLDAINPTITAPAAVTVSANATCGATSVVLGTPVTADNCSVASVTNNGLTTYPLGTTTVTWTVTDGSGNTATATQLVTVIDTTIPTITAPANVTVSANNSCVAINVALGTPVTADNCSVASVTNNGLSSYPLGTTTVTWTVTDASGNTATATQTVTVNDTTLPTIVAPAALTVSSSATCGVTGLALGTPVTGDNCSVASVTNNAPATFPLGTTTVTWTVTDGSGNIRTATQLVTVVDNTPPLLIAPAAIITTANASCGATVVLGTPVTADNCSVASVTNNGLAVYPLGTTTVTWTATDGSGNTTTATQTVTVNDTTDPTITAPASITVAANNSCVAINVALGTPITADNCSVASVTNNGLASYPLGSTIVTWTVTDGSGNTTTALQTVTVIDTTLPTIVAPAALTVSSSATCGVTGLALGTPVTGDNCSVASTTNNAPTTFPLGATTVTWTVTDGSGNTATATQLVTVVDTTLPTITAPAAVTVTANAACGATAVVLGTPVTADNCSVASVSNNGLTTYPLGTTTVTWTVVDGSGNTATATQIVTVIDTTNPTITAPAAVTVSTNNDCAAFNVALGTPLTADNCSVASVTNNAPVSFPLGNTTVTWTVVDGSGNSATTTQLVTVIDTTNPTIFAPAAISIFTDTTSCTATNVVLENPVTLDNCSVASVTNNAPVAFPNGDTIVTWTVTDGSGNTATATQLVSVSDNVLPVVITQNISVFLNASGQASITAAQINNGSTDNCAIDTITVSPTTFNCSNVGPNVVTLTVTDVNGNVATATAVVTVVDAIAPTVLTQNITVALDENGQASITAAMINNGSFDNCSVSTVSLNTTTFNCSNVGSNTVLLTVTDANGNVTIVPAQVVVTNSFGDNDFDGAQDNCDDDDDNDGVADTVDNCPLIANGTQSDNDSDGLGDACDDDDDNDGIVDDVDNCPLTYNPNQEDRDNDGTGDVCDLIEVNISQAVTPNGDGVNDTWMIYNLENYPNNTVRVFNRWGSEVFFAKGYQNDWNGFYKNSDQSLPDSGSYYYQIDLDGNGSIEKEGWLYISRL